MSYEGVEVYLCSKRHKSVFDCYDPPKHPTCECGNPFVWIQYVDYTNGTDPDDPNTFVRDLKEIGFDDQEHKDYKGNIYYTKRIIYEIPTDPPGEAYVYAY